MLSQTSRAPQEPAVRGYRVSSTVGSSEQARQMPMKIILLRAVAGIRSVLLSTFLLKDYIFGTNPPVILYRAVTMVFND